VAHTARISASGQDAALTVNSDSADTASFPGPVRPRHHCVALVGQLTSYSGSQTLFKTQLIRVIGVRLERAWIAVGGKARRLNGRLRQHAKDGDVEEDLQHRLALHVTTGSAEWHPGLAVLKDNGRARGEARALARCNG